MEADPTEIGVEGIALLNQLSRAYTTVPDRSSGLCRKVRASFQESDKFSYRRHLSSGSKRGDVPQDFQCVYLIENPKAEEVGRHLSAGLALSDLYCDTYFRRIARRWNERLFTRNTANDVGTAISAALGLAQAGSIATGAAGVGFGLIDGTFRNYDNVFVVSPDLGRMQSLVHAAQVTKREEIEGAMPTDYYDAQRLIVEYANLCSYTGMKHLLDDSVDEAVNNRLGPDGILTRAVDARTARDRQERLVAERRAAEAVATAAAMAREKTARDQIASGEDAVGEE